MKIFTALCVFIWFVAAFFLSPATARDLRTFTPLKLKNTYVKWGHTDLGSPARVTYAFVRDHLRQDGARNCRQMDSLDGLAEASDLDIDDIRKEASIAFDMWEAASGVSFLETHDIDNANIIIGVQTIPRGYAFSNVEFAEASDMPDGKKASEDRALNRPAGSPAPSDNVTSGKIARITKSAICLNPLHHWKIGFDGNLKTYDLRYTFAHEIGHTIGLDHFLRDRSIMHFKYRETFRTLQKSDIQGAQWLYGLNSDEYGGLGER